MKCTNFYKKIKDLEALEYKELRLAIQAHNGEYIWKEDEEKPIIAINPDWTNPHPIDVIVTKVSLENGSLKIFGLEKEYEEEVGFIPSNAFAGHIASIIEYIPETKNVKDVSIKES